MSMQHHLFATAPVLLCCFAAACQPSHLPRQRSGVDVRLRPASASASELRPEGVLQFRGHDNEVSVYVPVAPLDTASNAQRVGLPPGAYSVTYHPTLLDDGFLSLRSRGPSRVVSQNPFFVSVPEGKFVAIDVEHRVARWPPR
jgi:hypothetical protein